MIIDMNNAPLKTDIRLLFIIVYFIILHIYPLNLSAQERLHFNGDKQFKIVQFTDTHFYLGGKRSQEVLDNIKEVMEAEMPDLVILTGDIITGSGENWPTIASWDTLTNLLIKFKTPYAITFGNHDDEAQTSRMDLLNYLSNRPYCIINDEGGDEVEGVGNYVLPVYNSDGVVEKLIYCMDSRSYSLAEDKGINGYGWFDQSQIRWFAEINQSWSTKNQDIQCLLFFHIPIPEYKQAFFEGEFKIGVRMEEECSPVINTGMFSEMVLQGNVLGAFVGHDHNNNYVAQLYGIALGYGYFSGGNSYGDLPLNGARVILLEENQRTFKTWLRRSDGVKLYTVEFPYSKK